MKNKHVKKGWIIAAVSFAAAMGVGLWLHNRQQIKSPVDEWQDGVNYRPPTEEEKNTGDEKKKEIIAEEEQQNQQDQPKQQTGKKTVSVAITDASQYGNIVEVRSFVPSYSRDGTCTLTFTQGAHSFTRSTPGYKDISSTVCPAVEVKTSDFPNSGDWQVVVSFESTDAKGQSEPRTFTVEK